MPSPFDQYTLAKAREKIPVDRDATGDAGYALNRRLYNGDHWLDGDGWVGPQPNQGETGATEVLAQIKRAFISKNAVREVVDRHTAGVIGQEPAWKFTPRRAMGTVEVEEEEGGDEWGINEEKGLSTFNRVPPRKVKKTIDEQPTPEEQALIDEAETALTEWWDERGVHTVMQEACASLLLCGRSSLRLFVPPGKLEESKRTGLPEVPPGDLADSLSRIYIHAPDPMQATVITDPRTQKQAGIYVYQDEESKQDRAELVYLDDQGRTVIRVFGTEGSAQAPLDLGGHLTIYEMERAPLVTPQVRQLQALLNMALTMLSRNVVLAGFLERILLNVQLPGTYVETDGVRRFIPDPFQVGAGTTNSLMGATYRDEQGLTKMASPSIVYRDPVPVNTFRETKEEAYVGILEETDQKHALISGDATASGESRKQARADFEMNLGETEARINREGRWLLETALAEAATFSGQPGRFASLRCVFECRMDSGPLSGDEMRLIQELTGGQALLSVESGQVRIKVADVDAEKAKIAAEKEERQQAMPQQIVQVPPAAQGNGVMVTERSQ